MQLRWTEEAADDLTRIADYLLIHTPDRASELVRVLYEAPAPHS
jgi:plasmid stabilization system protein ParE